MSLYYEGAEILQAPANVGGSLKSRVFGHKSLKSQPAQIYALVIETCKWSSVLKEIIEKATLLSLERKLTPALSLLLVHDLLLAKRGIALPATHGLRAGVERHKARIQAEFTKARVKRSLGSVEAFKEWIDSGEAESSKSGEPPHPRWIRINTLKADLEDLMGTIFPRYERVLSIDAVRRRGPPRLYIDGHIPNLIAIPACVDLSKSEAYKSGALIFQDKASCFPAYLLDPLPEDGDVMDTCAAPGNKTTHLAAILSSHSNESDERKQTIHAFERDKFRAQTLQKMVALAGSESITKVHGTQDFLKVDPQSPAYAQVGALLLDPSCSGSGIVGRDEMPELHLPQFKSSFKPSSGAGGSKPRGKPRPTKEDPKKDTLKRKRDELSDPIELLIDDDGNTTAVTTAQDLQARLTALSTFQLALLLHAFTFPAARKITYSTCSIHFEENESVVLLALESEIAKERGWRILRREDQVRGLKEWPVRGDENSCPGKQDVADACIRANRGDGHGTMGFFLAGFVRNDESKVEEMERSVLRDESGHIVRDLMGIPVPVVRSETAGTVEQKEEVDEEWGGFGDDDGNDRAEAESHVAPLKAADVSLTPTTSSVKLEESSSSKKKKKKKTNKAKK